MLPTGNCSHDHRLGGRRDAAGHELGTACDPAFQRRVSAADVKRLHGFLTIKRRPPARTGKFSHCDIAKQIRLRTSLRYRIAGTTLGLINTSERVAKPQCVDETSLRPRGSRLKTQAVRLDDMQIELIETVARIEGCRTSDVIRMAIRDLLAAKALEHNEVRAQRDAAVRRRNEDNRRATEALVGEIDSAWS